MRHLILAVAAMSALGGSALAQQRETQVGDWRVWTDRDAITDKTRAGMSLRNGETAIIVKCDEAGPGKLYVHFVASEFLGETIPSRYDRGRHRDLIHRFDDRPAVTGRWIYGDSDAILVDRGPVGQFLDGLHSAERLVLRATTYRGREVTEIFTIRPEDTAIALRQVYEGCA